MNRLNRSLAAASRISTRLTLVAFAAFAGAGVAHAQNAADPNTQGSQPVAATQAAPNDASNDVGGSYAGSMSSGGANGLTRAQVRQDLAHAERDGQIQQLNQTLYKGGQ